MIAAIVVIAAGGATIAKAVGGSAAGPLVGRIDGKIQHQNLTKSQRLKLDALRGASVSTRAEARRFLRALGMNPRGFVIQLGKRNYAGPSCPGKGWSCTTARRVLQALGDNDFQCPAGDVGSSATPPNQCVVVQVNGGYAKCVERTRQSPGTLLTQECSITQGPNANGDNGADIVQVADQQDKGSATQDIIQNAFVMQTNGAGANRVSIRQEVRQSAAQGDTSVADVTQIQDAHQLISIAQTTANTSGTAGDNRADVDQSQDQKAKAKKATSSITQLQNSNDRFDTSHCPTFSFLDDEFSNQCSAVIQLSNTDATDLFNPIVGPNGGKNSIQVKQHVNQGQDAKNTAGGEQGQGSSNPTIGGLDHRFIQHSSGVSKQTSLQNEDQKQRRTDTGTMTAYEHGPTRKGTGEQSDNPANTASQKQDSKQDSKGSGLQESTDVLTDQCTSSGNCDTDQKVDSNGNKAQNHQSGPSFLAFIACGDVSIFPGGGDFAFLRLTDEVPPCSTSSDTTSVTTGD
jgi:hypothetical protein